MARKGGAPENLKPFVKGDPRINRKGQPKKLPILKALMAELLGVKEGEDMTKSELAKVAKAMIETAKSKKSYNQVNAAKEILDRAFGKVKEAEHTDGNELKITININRDGNQETKD